MKRHLKSKNKTVLFCGESDAGGAARYLLGIMSTLKLKCRHIPPSRKLKKSDLSMHPDLIIFGDYPHRQLDAAIEKEIVRRVKAGCGLLMVGGWGSFSGPFGGWRGSEIETILPVTCRSQDDRLNFPAGAHMAAAEDHKMIQDIILKHSPALVGINDVKVKEGGRILIVLRKLLPDGERISYDPVEYPLLIVPRDDSLKVAVFTSDFAPHWCGGLVDWGRRTRKIEITGAGEIEVGDLYIRFVSSILTCLISYRHSPSNAQWNQVVKGTKVSAGFSIPFSSC